MNKLILLTLLLLTACQPVVVIGADVEAYDNQDRLINRTRYKVVIVGGGELAGMSFREPALRPAIY